MVFTYHGICGLMCLNPPATPYLGSSVTSTAHISPSSVLGGSWWELELSVRVQVPNIHILTQNWYYNYY